MTDAPPIVISPAGPQPTPPATLNADLIEIVSASDPGYTVLPGGLVEDLSSTGTGALVITDSFRVDLINSLTPFGSNPFLTTQLGNIYGVPAATASNTSIYVVFSGTVGFAIGPGFTVGDGTYQYSVVSGGVINSGGSSDPIFCLATIPGSWAVGAGTVTTLVTSVPNTITLSCVNPTAGTPGGGAQTLEQYRAAVLQAGLAASQGMTRYLKTLLGNIPNVQQRLISARLQTAPVAGWEIICGGGDEYTIANAIYEAVFYLPGLVGSTINITGITNATLGVVTTDLNHGLTTGQANVHIAGVLGMTAANGGPYTVIVVTEKTFTFGVNTSGFGAYTSGGVVTPNSRNIVVSIIDYPDTYAIPFVNPPQQTVTIDLTWNTDSPNFVAPTTIQQLGAPAIIAYINSIAVGQPINLFLLQETFQLAVASALPPAYLTRMVFTVFINGVSTPPTSGTGLIPSDPESFLFAAANAATIIQG